MESNERELICYNTLAEVFRDNAYASLSLTSALKPISDERDRASISALFYGVIEKSIQLNYIIGVLTTKRPKLSVELIIKMAIYKMRYQSVPSYAAINCAVELSKSLGKSGVSGFINAVLRKSLDVKLPSRGEVNDEEYLSVNYSVPRWLIKKLLSEYDFDFVHKFLSFEDKKLTHIRFNSRVTTKDDFEKKLSNFDFERSPLGYYVTHNVLASLEKSLFTPQSLSSMIAVNAYISGKKDITSVLDLCGAPGGKSIYLEELVPNAKIYCCDIHPHRVELIKKYVRRMKSNVIPLISDATSIMPEWINAFDLVICDVPCSGIGVYKNKPDILFNKREEDIKKIASLQADILDVAKNYVKVGGRICYSTCTILKEENDDVVDEFLRRNQNFALEKIDLPQAKIDGKVRLFPHIDGCDGFFVAAMRRVS